MGLFVSPEDSILLSELYDDNKDVKECVEATIRTLLRVMYKDVEESRAIAEDYFQRNDFAAAIITILHAEIQVRDSGVAINFNCCNYALAYMTHKLALSTNNIYVVLGVNKDATIDEIKKKYKENMLKLHPDKCSSIAAEGAAKFMNAAYEILSEPIKRNKYDQELLIISNKRRPAATPSSSNAPPCKSSR